MPPESVPSQAPPAAPAEWQGEEPLARSSDFIIEVAQPAAAPAEVAPPPASVPPEPAPVETAVVAPPPASVPPQPAPVETAEAPEPEPVVAPPEPSRPTLDTIVEPTLVPHGRPFMLSATFLNPPPERPPLQSATTVEPVETVVAEPSQPERAPSEVPPAPVSADGTLVMPVEEIGELPPDRESRPQLYTLPLEGFAEEVLTGGPAPAPAPSASGSLSPLELAVIDDPVDLPVQRVRPAIAAMVAAALTAALMLLVMDRPEAPRAQAGVPLPFTMVMSCDTNESTQPVVTSAQGLKTSDDDEQKSATEVDDEEPDEAVSSAPAVKSKAKSKKAAKPKPRAKAKAKAKRTSKARTKAKRPKKSKAKKAGRKRPKKKTGGFLSQLPPKKSKAKKADRKSAKRPRGKKRR